MDDRLSTYIGAQTNLTEEGMVYGLCTVTLFLSQLDFSMEALFEAWLEEYENYKEEYEANYASDDEAEFDPHSFDPNDPLAFARQVVDAGHALRVRPPLLYAVCRQIEDVDELRLYQIFHDFSVGTTESYGF